MIRYTLRCENDHGFESWFRSAEAFEQLQTAGQVTCPDCASAIVAKAPMAPRVRTKDAARPPAPAPMPEEALKKLREHVETSSDYVGKDFATEARKMHEGDAPERSIYGEAKLEDARKLVEDGIPAVPLPFVPKRKTN